MGKRVIVMLKGGGHRVYQHVDNFEGWWSDQTGDQHYSFMDQIGGVSYGVHLSMRNSGIASVHVEDRLY